MIPLSNPQGHFFDASQKKCFFRIWAPYVKNLTLILHPGETNEKNYSFEKKLRGFWELEISDISSNSHYSLSSESFSDLPDPLSYSQPLGVHGPSQIVDHQAYQWRDHDWLGLSLSEMVIYELHLGTFTTEGTFDAAISRLDDLVSLGINAIEVMPVAQFPGKRNWGYDGVQLFATQNSYGGVEDFKRFVDSAHQKGVAVLLDVVYNHFGPEGNYLAQFGPYFTDKYSTPWGSALNYDDRDSDVVRDFFLSNALYWFEHFHLDGLRLDAVHAIYDYSAKHFLQELKETVDAWAVKNQRKVSLIAESDMNDPKMIRSTESYGFGMDAQWSDDFHHSLHALLTGERAGYYQDYGKVADLEKAVRQHFIYDGKYSSFRRRKYGAPPQNLSADRFVVFSQNHDQVGNRKLGDRLSKLVCFESLKVAAGLTLLAPSVPLLFMGEEYGEENPFYYFVSHGDEDLIQAVREGRAREFSGFDWKGDIPDPQAEETFQSSILNWSAREKGKQAALLSYYQSLIHFRKNYQVLREYSPDSWNVQSSEEDSWLLIERFHESQSLLIFSHFGEEEASVLVGDRFQGAKKILDSKDPKWHGSGASHSEILTIDQTLTLRPKSLVVYIKEN